MLDNQSKAYLQKLGKIPSIGIQMLFSFSTWNYHCLRQITLHVAILYAPASSLPDTHKA